MLKKALNQNIPNNKIINIMARYNDNQEKKFKKEIDDALKAIENLKSTDVVSSNDERLSLIITAKSIITEIDANFDETQK